MALRYPARTPANYRFSAAIVQIQYYTDELYTYTFHMPRLFVWPRKNSNSIGNTEAILNGKCFLQNFDI